MHRNVAPGPCSDWPLLLCAGLCCLYRGGQRCERGLGTGSTLFFVL